MQISKNLVYTAAAAFLALFAAVFFLLGRESTRRRAPAAAPVAPQPAPEAEPPRAALNAQAAPPSGIASAPTPATPSAPAMPTTAPRPSGGPAVPSPALAMAPLPPLEQPRPAQSDAAAAARDYFLQMQAIQTVASTNDTSEFANKLLTASMTGDSSGFDDLIKVMQAGAARARMITPPPCCVEYHQRLLAMLAESTTMVEQLKSAIARNDSGALTTLASSASSLQSRANALDEDARSIKTRLGLAR